MGTKSDADSGASSLLLFEFVFDVTRAVFLELLKMERRLETSLESRSRSFHEAAAAGVQLTMTATFNSTTLGSFVSGLAS